MATKHEPADKTSKATATAAAQTPASSPTPPAPALKAGAAKPASPALKAETPTASPAAQPKLASKATPLKKQTTSNAVRPAAKKPSPVKPIAAATQPVTEAAPVHKGVTSMNEFGSKFADATKTPFTEEAKANVEAAAAELGSQTKDAFAKTNKLAEDAVAFNKSNVEAVVESTKIAAKNLEVLRDETLSYARKSFEDQSAALKSLLSVKTPADFFNLYAENSKKALEAAIAQGSKNSELLVKLTNESFAPISNRVSVITAQLKVA